MLLYLVAIVFAHHHEHEHCFDSSTGSKRRLSLYLTKHKIEGFALRNSRDRLLIPSAENMFGRVRVDYVLIDSGCNAALSPMPRSNIRDRKQLYSSVYDTEKYNRTLSFPEFVNLDLGTNDTG